jgi:2-polyprenyl-3-methyl-5-hydroxy-6-metoxy-1,4-benzoquinol methylase
MIPAPKNASSEKATSIPGDGIRHLSARFLYHRYRAARRFFSARPPDIFTHIFFWLREHLQVLISSRRLSRFDELERRLWKAIYFQRFGTTPLYRLETNHAVAMESADHNWPRGTAFDNSTNRNFNLKLYAYFNNRSDLRVLDLGCAGGGFVRSILEDGFTAVGLEGSDWSQKLRSGEWDTCPHHLLTCDITSCFQLRTHAGEAVTFHCITAWEVLEHIPTEKLSALIEGIGRHLAPDGIFVASVDTAPDSNPATGAVYHATLQPKFWWLKQFESVGLVELDQHPFVTRDYVRGHGMGLQDWDPADGEGFHLVLCRRRRQEAESSSKCSVDTQ